MTEDADANSGRDFSESEEVSLRDELGIEDLSQPVLGARGRLFSTAGRDTPVAELTEAFVILHPPQKPFDEAGFDDALQERVSPRGVLLNAIGNEICLTGAKFRGQPIFCLAARDNDTGKRLVAYFDQGGMQHYLFWEGRALTYFEALQLRNSTHNGEISSTASLVSSADA